MVGVANGEWPGEEGPSYTHNQWMEEHSLSLEEKSDSQINRPSYPMLLVFWTSQWLHGKEVG